MYAITRSFLVVKIIQIPHLRVENENGTSRTFDETRIEKRKKIKSNVKRRCSEPARMKFAFDYRIKNTV